MNTTKLTGQIYNLEENKWKMQDLCHTYFHPAEFYKAWLRKAAVGALSCHFPVPIKHKEGSPSKKHVKCANNNLKHRMSMGNMLHQRWTVENAGQPLPTHATTSNSLLVLETNKQTYIDLGGLRLENKWFSSSRYYSQKPSQHGTGILLQTQQDELQSHIPLLKERVQLSKTAISRKPR